MKTAAKRANRAINQIEGRMVDLGALLQYVEPSIEELAAAETRLAFDEATAALEKLHKAMFAAAGTSKDEGVVGTRGPGK